MTLQLCAFITAHSSCHNLSLNPDYLEDFSRAESLSILSKCYFSGKTLDCLHICNGIVLPPKVTNTSQIVCYGGVLDENRKYVDMSAQTAENYYGQKLQQLVLGAYDISEYNVAQSDETVIYMNCMFTSHWGHFLIDIVGRLWYALQNTDYRIVYTCFSMEQNPISGRYLELLELMGIPEARLLGTDKVTQFRKIIIPEVSILSGRYFTQEYRDLFSRAVANSGAVLAKSDKIYCSRRHFEAAQHKEDGEQYIEKVFTDNGFRAVYMEQMTVEEQIRILNSASEIAMFNGTLAHNLVFVRNNAKVTIIDKTHITNVYQPVVNQIPDAEICVVDAYVAPLPVGYGLGPFIVRLTKEFLKYCEDRGVNYRHL